MTANNPTRQSLIIGAAWNRTKENEKGTFDFRSLSLTGKRDEDKFEVLLRSKDGTSSHSLSTTSVMMVNNDKKKSEKHPDFVLKAYLDDVLTDIGVAWSKTKENDRGPYTFDSIALSGKREQDTFEIILRKKDDNAELALFETPVIMVPSNTKKTEKHPDFLVKVFFE